MAYFNLLIQATGSYSTTAPTLEVLVNGVVMGAAQILAGGTSASFLLEYDDDFPQSLSLRFNDGSGEGGRTISIDSFSINGQTVDTANLSAILLVQDQVAQANIAATDHLYGRQDIGLGDIGAPDQTGTGGDDRIVLGSAGEIVDAGGGDDRVLGLGSDDAIFGGDGADTMFGGGGNDILAGEGGNDILSGDAGDDILHGGDGNDTMRGGIGNDVLNGGAGNDNLRGDAGNDILYGDDGDDRLLGQDGDDVLFGDDGVDTLSGGNGNDILFGGADNDTLYGGANDDLLYGEDGNDTLYGEAGNDTLYGAGGADTMFGGAGNDTLYAANASAPFLNVNFNSGTDGFTYTDGLFGSSGSSNDYAAGSHTGAALQIDLGGINNNAATDISGGWHTNFNVAESTAGATLEFAYRVQRSGTYETNEDTYVYVEIDGTRYGLNGNDYINYYESDGNDPDADSGWINVTIDLGLLSAGTHTIVLGGYNEGKTASDEDSTIYFDNVTVAPPADGDNAVSNVLNGQDGDDILYGSSGTDTLNGGNGNDSIYSASVANVTSASVLAANPGMVYNATYGSFYLFVNSAVTWDTAYADAISRTVNGVSGYLTHSTSTGENAYIDGITGGSNFWLGANDLAVNGEWRWIGGPEDGIQFWQGVADGSAVGGAYTNWNPGEPNDYNGYEAHLEFQNGGRWNDQLPGTTRAYLVEWDASQILQSGNTAILNGGDGLDNLYGSDGTDIFVFESASAFNDIDVMHDFDVNQGDALDLSDILTGYDPLSDLIADFVMVTDGSQDDTYQQAIENYDPLLYYRLDETSGSTAYDSTGTLDGSYVNSPNLNQTGFNGNVSNRAADFAGGTGGAGNREYIRVDDGSEFDMSEGTFMAWFRSDRNSSTDQIVLCKEGTGSSGQFYIGIDTNSGNVVGRLQIGGNSYDINVDPSGVLGDDINRNEWYHMAFTFGTGGATIYINGQAVYNNANFTSIGSNYDFIIGAQNSGGNNSMEEYFSGRIDEVAVFDRKMGASTVDNIYQAGLNATDGALSAGVYVDAAGTGPYAAGDQIAGFAGSSTYDDTASMLAGGHLIV